MRILEVSRYKGNYADHQLPFVTEQGISLRDAGCEVDFFLVKGNYLKAVKSLKAKIREFKPDIVHAHYGLSAVTAELQSIVPVVTTFHNGEWHKWWVNLVSSLMALRAQHLIYVAPHIRERMYFKHQHYTVLPCGVNLVEIRPTDYFLARKSLGFENGRKYILFGGAFSNRRKNVSLLREALSFGKIDAEVIEMRGMDRKTVALYMCACDLFALPTRNEGSPQALKEAMACNCPIVATDCADIAHLLGDLEGHFLLSNKGKSKAEWEGDECSVSELAGLMREALALPVGFRTRGRERIEELGYTNEKVARKLLEIYNKVLS